jgi:hypothetical protein
MQRKLRWANIHHSEQFFQHLSKRLSLNNLDEFYRITKEDIRRNGGSSALEKFYEGSLKKALISVYPQHLWCSWKFTDWLPNGYWKNEANVKEFLDWLGQHLNFKHMDDWYQITRKDIEQNGGNNLLYSFKNSPRILLTSIYPNHTWISWKFRNSHLLEDERMDFVEWLGKELKIRDLDDWYRVSISQVNKFVWILRQNPLHELLPQVYPQYQWNIAKLQTKAFRASQRVLVVQLEKIFPNSGILYLLKE